MAGVPGMLPRRQAREVRVTWLLLATGFTGALTLVSWARVLRRFLGGVPSAAVFFSPRGGCTEAILHELGRARREVLVLAYGFTSQPIAESLVQCKLRGVHV